MTYTYEPRAHCAAIEMTVKTSNFQNKPNISFPYHRGWNNPLSDVYNAHLRCTKCGTFKQKLKEYRT